MGDGTETAALWQVEPWGLDEEFERYQELLGQGKKLQAFVDAVVGRSSRVDAHVMREAFEEDPRPNDRVATARLALRAPAPFQRLLLELMPADDLLIAAPGLGAANRDDRLHGVRALMRRLKLTKVDPATINAAARLVIERLLSEAEQRGTGLDVRHHEALASVDGLARVLRQAIRQVKRSAVLAIQPPKFTKAQGEYIEAMRKASQTRDKFLEMPKAVQGNATPSSAASSLNRKLRKTGWEMVGAQVVLREGGEVPADAKKNSYMLRRCDPDRSKKKR